MHMWYMNMHIRNSYHILYLYIYTNTHVGRHLTTKWYHSRFYIYSTSARASEHKHTYTQHSQRVNSLCVASTEGILFQVNPHLIQYEKKQNKTNRQSPEQTQYKRAHRNIQFNFRILLMGSESSSFPSFSFSICQRATQRAMRAQSIFCVCVFDAPCPAQRAAYAAHALHIWIRCWLPFNCKDNHITAHNRVDTYKNTHTHTHNGIAMDVADVWPFVTKWLLGRKGNVEINLVRSSMLICANNWFIYHRLLRIFAFDMEKFKSMSECYRHNHLRMLGQLAINVVLNVRPLRYALLEIA